MIRLIRQDDIGSFTVYLTSLRADLLAAVEELDEHFGELQSQARQRLGRLFHAADYPASLAGLFDCSWEFPSVEPPEYLRQLSPQLYEQEAARVAARFFPRPANPMLPHSATSWPTSRRSRRNFSGLNEPARA